MADAVEAIIAPKVDPAAIKRSEKKLNASFERVNKQSSRRMESATQQAMSAGLKRGIDDARVNQQVDNEIRKGASDGLEDGLEEARFSKSLRSKIRRAVEEGFDAAGVDRGAFKSGISSAFRVGAIGAAGILTGAIVGAFAKSAQSFQEAAGIFDERMAQLNEYRLLQSAGGIENLGNAAAFSLFGQSSGVEQGDLLGLLQAYGAAATAGDIGGVHKSVAATDTAAGFMTLVNQMNDMLARGQEKQLAELQAKVFGETDPTYVRMLMEAVREATANIGHVPKDMQDLLTGAGIEKSLAEINAGISSMQNESKEVMRDRANRAAGNLALGANEATAESIKNSEDRANEIENQKLANIATNQQADQMIQVAGQTIDTMATATTDAVTTAAKDMVQIWTDDSRSVWDKVSDTWNYQAFDKSIKDGFRNAKGIFDGATFTVVARNSNAPDANYKDPHDKRFDGDSRSNNDR